MWPFKRNTMTKAQALHSIAIELFNLRQIMLKQLELEQQKFERDAGLIALISSTLAVGVELLMKIRCAPVNGSN